MIGIGPLTTTMMANHMHYWLMKTEPEAFSIDDLERAGTEPWDGIRNYQARNFMRDDMALGDQVMIYHSNCKPPGIAGLGEVASQPYPDPTQFDSDSKYFDAGSDPEEPRWQLVDIKFVRKLKRLIPLDEIKQHADSLDGLVLIRKGSRLSIMPVDKPHWNYLLKLE